MPRSSRNSSASDDSGVKVEPLVDDEDIIVNFESVFGKETVLLETSEISFT
jgi:hypothetical protein